MSETTSPWAPLRNRIFFALFLAQLVSNLGTLMQAVGASWLMGDLGAPSSQVALVQTASFLPVVMVGIPAGVLADLFDRRKLLILTQAGMLVSATAMALMTFSKSLTPNGVLLLTFLLGTFSALMMPAWSAIQPDLVPKDQFGQAVALSAMTFNLGRAVGPALGGLLITAAGPGWVFALNAVSFLGTMGVLLSWKPQATTATALPSEKFSGAMITGLRYGVNSGLVRAVLVRVAVLMMPGVALSALLPSVVRGPLHWSSGGYGILLGCFGLGASISSVVRPRIIAVCGTDTLMVIASLATAATLLVQGFVHHRIVLGVVLFAGGFLWNLAVTATNVAAQQAMPSWVRARGMALYSLVLTGSVAIGSAIAGALSGWSLSGAHLVAAIAIALGSLTALRWKLADSGQLDLTLIPGDSPTVAMEPDHDDGPVLVTVTYQVAAPQLAEFGQLMVEIERHRKRTGAFRWGLYRDLAEPDRFVETFLVSSWAEHLRQHHRTTTVASEMLQQLAPFRHPGSRGPGHYLSTLSEGSMEPHVPNEPVEVFAEEDC